MAKDAKKTQSKKNSKKNVNEERPSVKVVEEKKKVVINEEKKPKCALIGQDGNIFNLIGIASRTLKNNGMLEESEEMVNRITKSHNYYDAIAIIGEYVDISDSEYDDEDEEDYYDDEEFE